MMIKHILGILLIIIAFSEETKGQITSDKYSHDFGDVTEDSSRTVDFIIHNQYRKSVSPSYFGFSLDVSTQFSAYSIPKDSSIIFRVKITSDKVGPIEKKFNIKFWDREDSLQLVVKANVLSFDYDKNYPLEPFPKPKEENDEDDIDLPINFKIIDSEDKTPIHDARISLSTNYLPYKNVKTNSNGEAEWIVNNSYSVDISAPGYQYYSGDISIGCNDSVRIVELVKYEVYSAQKLNNQVEEAQEQSNEDIQTIDEIIALLDEEPIDAPLDDRFKSNNIVFLMDISISMVDHKRIELLKTSLVNMIEILRPEDRLSVITFNTTTQVFIDPIFATEENKNSVIYKIKKLKAKGLTNGGEGLKMSYDFIADHFSEDANNQVILSTDGGLNAYVKHDDVLDMVEEQSDKVKTSIILLKGYDWSVKYMSEITDAGKGHLLMIDNHHKAKSILIKEIKANSYITKE